MSSYTKLFDSLITSTIWREDHRTRIVWITLLVLSDRDGIVEASIPGLADMARVTTKECEDALAVLMAPDPYSRTKDHEGRRVEPVDGGFKLLNHAKYREKLSKEDRREYHKAYWHARKASQRRRTQLDSTPAQQNSTDSTQAEAEASASAGTDVGQTSLPGASKSRPASQPIDTAWLEGLSANPAYEGIDVRREFAKMLTWCDVKHKKPSRRRLVNWLNRVERPLQEDPSTPKAHHGAGTREELDQRQSTRPSASERPGPVSKSEDMKAAFQEARDAIYDA